MMASNKSYYVMQTPVHACIQYIHYIVCNIDVIWSLYRHNSGALSPKHPFKTGGKGGGIL